MWRRIVGYLGRHGWGIVATFMALGGTTYAAVELPANSVGSRQLRAGSVTLGKLSHRARSALHTAASAGYTAEAPNSDSSGSDQVSVSVPAGKYVASGGCTAYQGSDAQTSSLTFIHAEAFVAATAPGQTLPSTLDANSPGVFGAETSVSNRGVGTFVGHTFADIGSASLADAGGFTLPHGGSITETCKGDDPVYFNHVYVTAIRVATLSAGKSS